MSWRLSGSAWPGAQRGGYQLGPCFNEAAGAVHTRPGVVFFPPSCSSCLARSCPWWILATHNPVFTGGKKPHPDMLGGRRTLFALHVSFHMGTLGTLAKSTWSKDFASTLAVSTIIQNLMSYVKTQTVVGDVARNGRALKSPSQ